MVVDLVSRIAPKKGVFSFPKVLLFVVSLGYLKNKNKPFTGL